MRDKLWSIAQRAGPVALLSIMLGVTWLAWPLAQTAHAQVPDGGRDTRSWTDPGGSGLTVTFSTPDLYPSCTSAYDRIYTEGIPDTWSLTGFAKVLWATENFGPLEEVPNGLYEVNQNGNLDLTVYYPPASAWPDYDPTAYDAREIHVDLSIVVRDENGEIVSWVGGDPNVPGTLGPGGQDWDLFCSFPPEPDISIIKFTNGQDANDPDAAGVPEIALGQPVVWTYDIENTGTVDIPKIYVTVTDNVAGVQPVYDSVKVGNGDDILAPGEIWTYRAEGVALDLETADLPTLVPDVCRQGDVNAPGRTAYTNLGTVSVLGAEDDTDPSSYCNPSLLTLGDRVWYDQNQNGIQDPNEPSYPDGLTVELFENGACADPAISTTTSDGNGFYQFSNLLAGTYSVQFSGLPAGWTVSPANQGGDDALDSDANADGCIENIVLTANDPDEDIGIYIPGSLGDDVRCLTTGEPLANITVWLFEDFDGNGVADGPAIETTETNATGFYQFSELEVALAGDPNNLTRYIVQVDTDDADLGTCNVPVPPTEYNPPLDSDNPDDPNNDFLFEEPPLAVSLGYANATRVGDGFIRFDWETATETGNIGFYLYMQAANDELLLLTSEMIPSTVIDSRETVAYSYEAYAVGERYYIEMVEISGLRDRQGPFSVGIAYGQSESTTGTATLPGSSHSVFLPFVSNR